MPPVAPASPAEWEVFRQSVTQRLRELTATDLERLKQPDNADIAGEIVTDFLATVAPRITFDAPTSPGIPELVDCIHTIDTLCEAHDWQHILTIINFYATCSRGVYAEHGDPNDVDLELVSAVADLDLHLSDHTATAAIPDTLDRLHVHLDLRRHLSQLIPEERRQEWFDKCLDLTDTVQETHPVETRRSALLLVATTLSLLIGQTTTQQIIWASNVMTLANDSDAPDARFYLGATLAELELAMHQPEAAAQWLPVICKSARTNEVWDVWPGSLIICDTTLYPDHLHDEVNRTRTVLRAAALECNETLSAHYLLLLQAAEHASAGNIDAATTDLETLYDAVDFAAGHDVGNIRWVNLWEQTTAFLASCHLLHNQPAAAIRILQRRLTIAGSLRLHDAPLPLPHVEIETMSMLCTVPVLAPTDAADYAAKGIEMLHTAANDRSMYMLRSARTMFDVLWQAKLATDDAADIETVFSDWQNYLEQCVTLAHDGEEFSSRTYGVECLSPAMPVEQEHMFWHQAKSDYHARIENYDEALANIEKARAIASAPCPPEHYLDILADHVFVLYALGEDDSANNHWQKMVHSAIELDIDADDLLSINESLCTRLAAIGREDFEELHQKNVVDLLME